MSSPLILKQELLKRITLFERARNAAIACDQQLTQKLARGILTEEMYVASYQQAFGKETAKFWISHYERNLKKCKKELRTCEKHLKQKQARRQHTTVIVILLLMMGLFITINPTFTGLFIGNETVINESFMNESLLNETFNETPNTTLIDTVELVNESNLTIEEVNTLNETEPPPLEENITVNTTEPELEAITNTTEETPEIIPESEEATEEITPLPEETTIIPSTIDNKEIEIQEVIAPTQVIVEQDATWIKKITVNDTVSTLTTEIPDSATAVKVMKNDQIEITDIEVQAENPAPAGNLFTGFAIFTPPSSVLENVSDNFTLVINDVITAQDEITVAYTTPGPDLEEEIVEEGKRITISSELHYQNITALSTIDNVAPSLIHIYWTTNETREEINFTYTDSDQDGKVNEIQWIVPHLSNQTYEIIIEISRAEHLDTKKKFVADITTAVASKDDQWSEKISYDEYVRVTFSQNLTNNNDITVYARGSDSKTTIEVYTKNSKTKIATFPTITQEGYYKVYLTAMSGIQDTFDLRIDHEDKDKNSYVEFDYITDPVAPALLVANNEVHDIDFAILNDTTGKFVVAYCDDTGDTAKYEIRHTNGSFFKGTSTVTIDAGAGDSCRISVSPLNDSTFVIAYIDWASASSDWNVSVRNQDNRAVYQPALIDADMSEGVDIDVCALNSTNFISVVVDATDDDATYAVHRIGAQVLGQIDVDAAAAPDAKSVDQETVDCTVINQQKAVLVYVDDNPDEIAYFIVNTTNAANITNNASVARYTVDASALNGSVAVDYLTDDHFVVAYCDDTDKDVSFRTYAGGNNANQAGITDVDTSIGGCAKSAGTAVTQSGENGTHVEVAALNGSQGEFVIIWDDAEPNVTSIAVYNSSGSQKLAPTIIDPISDKEIKALDVLGWEPHLNLSLCKYETTPVFLVGYNNQTNVYWHNYYSNGSIWDGDCSAPASNTAPSLSSATLNVSNSTLTRTGDWINASVAVTDADAGDKVNITARLYVNDAANITLTLFNNWATSTTASIIFNNTNITKGQKIEVQFNGSDETDTSNYVNTSEITANNTALTLASAALNITNSSTATAETFNSSVSVTDLDIIDRSNITLTLFINNVLNKTVQHTINAATGTTISYVWNATNITGGQTVVVQFNATDGTAGSNYINSTKVTIATADTAPVLASAVINESNSTLYTRNNLNVSISVTDADSSKSNITACIIVNQVTNSCQTLNNVLSGATPSYIFTDVWSKGQAVVAQFNASSHATVSNYINTTAITVNNTAPVIGNVSDITAQSITEDSFKQITFYFVASDLDGELNNNSARVNITNVNSTAISSNVSCLPVSSIGPVSVNYSCQVHIWYYYLPGEWKITAQVNDSNALMTQNTTKRFTIQDTTAVAVGPASLTFPVVTLGADNTTATNDPIVINNTGNHNSTAGNIKVTGINLRGESDATYIIPAANFTIRETTGGSPAVECGGNFLINGTQVAITNSTLAPGNRTAGQGTENIYGCLYDAPTSLTAQTYSATGGNSWTITVQ